MAGFSKFARAEARRGQQLRAWPTCFSMALPHTSTGGYVAGLPILRRAVKAARRKNSADDELRWLWLASLAASHLG